MGKKPDKDEDAKKKPTDSDAGLGDGGSRTDYDLFDWSGRQVDDHKEVRRKGSDR